MKERALKDEGLVLLERRAAWCDSLGMQRKKDLKSLKGTYMIEVNNKLTRGGGFSKRR